MSDSPFATKVDAEIREQLTTLDKRLRSTGTSSSTIAAIRRRREASAEVSKVAQTHPRAVYRLISSLVDTLRKELTGKWPAPDALVCKPLSIEIQHDISDTLAVILQPDLITAYIDAGHSLEPVIDVLAETLSRGDSPDAKRAALRGLGVLSIAIPEAVSRVASEATVVPAVGRQIGSVSTDRHFRAGARVLLATVQEAPSELPKTPTVQEAITKLSDSGDPLCRTFGTILAERGCDNFNQHETSWAGSSAVENLLDDVLTADTVDIKAARRLGLVVSLVPKVVSEPPWRLIERVRSTTRGDRWQAAKALGVVTAWKHTTDFQVKGHIPLVANATDASSGREAAIVGEIALAYPYVFQKVPRSFIQGLSKYTSPSDQALSALGNCIAIGANRDTAIREALHNRIQQTTGEQRRQALITLGEWAGHTTNTKTSLPTHLVEEIHRKSNEQTQSLAFALGLIAHGTEAWKICIEAIRGRRSDHWKMWSRGLGELAVSTPLGNHFLDLQQSQIQDKTGEDRRLLMQAIGVGIAHATKSQTRLHDALYDWVCTETTVPHTERVEILGEWVATVSDTISFEIAPLPNRTLNLDGRDRTRAVRAIGEVTMATSECRHPPLKALLLRLREAVEIKRVAASSLHRTIETGTSISSIAKASVETITPIVADPEWIVEAIGEVAAITPVETVAVPENLSTEVQRSTHWDRQQSARALGVAIAVMNNTISNPLESLVGDRVPFAAHPQSTDYILGEVAAADPDAFSSVPRPVITQIRSAEGETRRRLAEATGVWLSEVPSDAELSIQGLRRSVESDTGKQRRHKVRALGELAQALPENFEVILQRTPGEFPPPKSEDPSERAEVVGEVLLNDDVEAAVEKLMERFGNQSVFERKRRLGTLRTLADSGLIEPTQLLRAIGASTPSTHPDVTLPNLVLEFREPNRGTLLEAISAAVVNADTDNNSEMRVQIEALLARRNIIEPASQLIAVEMLSRLDPKPLSENRTDQ